MRLTTAFEARRRIVALLGAHPGLTGVLIARGAPTEKIESARELIYFGAALSDTDAEWGALGASRRDETYTLELNVYVFQEGDDEAATEARCEALCDEIAAALDADKYLGTPDRLLDHAVLISAFELATTPIADPKGWESTAQLSLDCRAPIRPDP